MTATSVPGPEAFDSFGELLKYLRKQRRLTQHDLALAVGYSESQISHLEQGFRAPTPSIIASRFVSALGLQQEHVWAFRLIELAASVRTLAVPNTLPLKTLGGMHNLPVHMTSFVGRERELGQVVSFLKSSTPNQASVRLVTLTGAGGCGKSRLAAQAALLLEDEFPQGVWWVDLASLSSPSLVPQTMAAVFGIKEQVGLPILKTLSDFLGSARLLVVLDNCEHLLAACATLAETILGECPRVKILATSRQSLNLFGEVTLRVPSLLTPDPHTLPSLMPMPRYDAVRLFLERATSVAPSFTLTNENSDAVAQICRQLDGNPLAIELAAARLRIMSVQEIAQGLDDRFQLLTAGPRPAPPRHQTLRALVDWSYDLLSKPERAFLCSLGVFAGGWTLESALAVARTDKSGDRALVELLGNLISKSLVMVEQRETDVRYQMQDTIRDYARKKLFASRRRRSVERAHAAYFLELAQGDRSLDAWFHPDPALYDRIESEYDNVRAALAWCQSPAGDPQLGIELVAALLRFWFERGYWSEWRCWVESALISTASLPPSSALARTYFGLGTVLAFQSEFRAATRQLGRSLSFYQELGDTPWSVYVAFRLGWLAREQDDTVTARQLMESSLAQFRAMGDNARVAEVLITLGEMAVMLRDPKWAKELLQEGISMQVAPGERRANLPWSFNHLAHVAQLETDYDRAQALHSASLDLFAEFGMHHAGIAWAHQGLGQVALARGDAVLAASHLKKALTLFRDLGDRMGIAWCFADFAAVAAHGKEHVRAAELWGAAETLRRAVGARSAPAVQAINEQLLGTSRAVLGDELFDELAARGGAMPIQQVLAQLVTVRPETGRVAP